MRNTLITLFISLCYTVCIGQQDSIVVYSKRASAPGDPFPYMNYEKQVNYLLDTVNGIYKIKHYVAYSQAPPLQWAEGISNWLPKNVTFKIDTNRVLMYYDTAQSNYYLHFNFNKKKGDTAKIFKEVGNYNIITIDSIVTRNFNFIGNKQVYYYHPGVPTQNVSFWVKGLFNSFGSMSNYHLFDMSTSLNTTCVEIKNNMIPVLKNETCGIYVMGADAPSHTKIKFSVSPNPATELLTITGELPATGNVRIDISNMLGQTITLANEKMPDKTFNKTVSIKNLPAGLYLLSLTQGETIYSQRIVKVGQ